jgi:hypothetical protein
MGLLHSLEEIITKTSEMVYYLEAMDNPQLTTTWYEMQHA